MVFTVLGAVAELERSLIAERVRAGLRSVRAKGVKLGRPVRKVDRARILCLRAEGRSLREIAVFPCPCSQIPRGFVADCVLQNLGVRLDLQRGHKSSDS